MIESRNGSASWRAALKVAAIFLVASAVWIVGSDAVIVRLAPNLESLAAFQTYKGLVYTAVMGLLIFVAVKHFFRREQWMGAALRESEERFRGAFETAAHGMGLVSPEGRWLKVNRALCDMVGYSEAELLATDFQTITHSDDLQSDCEYVRQLLAGEIPSYQMEKRYLHKNGSIVWILLSVSLVRDSAGKPIHFVSQVQDISERKRAEEALRDSETKLRAIFDHHYQLTGLLDPEGRLLATNKTALELVDADEAEVFGKYFWEGPWWNRSQEREVRSAIERAAGGEFVRFETTHPSADGGVRDIDFSLTPVRDDDGKVVYLVPEGRDITDMKRAEAEREQLIAHLERQNAELERFAYTVSHDLRTPLLSIRWLSDALAEDLAQGEEDRVREGVEQIAGSAETMIKLLDDVLELSRVGRIVNSPVEVPMDALTREVLTTLAKQLADAKVRVEMSSPLPTLWADRKRVAEVLQNLVHNAIKYMGKQPEPRIEIGARQNGSETICYVRDNGMGIDPRYHEKIFGLFDQLDPKADGSGIGLALTKRIIEAHGGRIWCESDGEGCGSTFFFTVPARRDGADDDV